MEIGADEDEKLDSGGGGDDDDGGVPDEVPTSAMKKPAAAGLSFCCIASGRSQARVRIRIAGGTYRREELPKTADSNAVTDDSNAANVDEADADGRSGGGDGPKYVWKRTDHEIQFDLQLPKKGSVDWPLEEHGLPGFRLHGTTSRLDEALLVTLVLVNSHVVTKGGSVRPDELALFQSRLDVRPGDATTLIARPIASIIGDEDAAVSQLLYRNARGYAVGHTCSAMWDESGNDTASCVTTTWMPRQDVHLVSTDGGRELHEAVEAAKSDPLKAEHLQFDNSDLDELLCVIPDAYSTWINNRKQAIGDLPEHFRARAELNLEECARSLDRMRQGASLVATNPEVRSAFRLMNKAMMIQRRWSEPEKEGLRWRPFQLAFILQCLPSISDTSSADREVMDLLWFPTGGGKTEAYLGLIAFVLFLRRIRRGREDDAGGGVTCIMRYTLRLLTLQQFERASTLILACEYLRTGREMPDGIELLSHSAPVSIGLWVGQGATPNDFAEAKASLDDPQSLASPRQLTKCPCCRKPISWIADDTREMIVARCTNIQCDLATSVPTFPVHTVDSQIYTSRPTLLIGTIDKFAQIVRNPETTALFNADSAPPPDIIIQDELHLISGPLGTLAAIYEVAIDRICSRDGYRPKLIGSTATIRRAREQVLALFDREVAQFPPPGLDASDSCFAVIPEEARNRRYVGVTTAGRSGKFTLQAVYASLIQGASSILDDSIRDGYSTLVGYFNALRELGGALVLASDDVDATIKLDAKRRNETPRKAKEIVELTSRVSQTDIRNLLDRLALPCTEEDAVDVVLATNMISVGVDVGRLALMVVMGQPKGIAEYIQSTSRVGRDRNAGLVVTVFNNAKARDRSHFETFCGWHQALYRGVEPTSVTPFAARARDRALHAAIVAIARHLVTNLRDQPLLDDDLRKELRSHIDFIVERASRIDPDEAEATRSELEDIVESWNDRSGSLVSYWNDFKLKSSLLMSAETAAARQVSGRLAGGPWPTLNSLRNVEAGTPFRLTEGLREK
jgi:hypothetical protein